MYVHGQSSTCDQGQDSICDSVQSSTYNKDQGSMFSWYQYARQMKKQSGNMTGIKTTYVLLVRGDGGICDRV